MADELYAQTLAETEDLEQELDGAEGKESKTEELLRRVLEDNRTANADLIRQIVGQGRPQPGQPLQEDDPLAGLEFKVDDLPDPAHDPAAFHRAYVERAGKAMRGAAAKIEERATQRAQKLLSDKDLFDKAESMVLAVEPDASKAVIGTASQAVADRYRAEGRDPMQELRRNMEGYTQEVADYIDDMRQQLGGAKRPSGGGGADRARGTLTARNRQPSQRQPAKEKPHDPLELLHDIQKLQREHRIY